MATGGPTILDGTQLRGGDLRLPVPGGAVTGARLLQYADSEAAARQFGVYLPESLRSAALRRVVGDSDRFLEQEFADEDSLKQKVREYLLALADVLADDPLAISVLDGSVLQTFLEDEDDFAMLAENLFTDLDTHDNGKVSKKEIQNALVLMETEMGVPPFSECSDLLNNLLNKHGAQGDEQLGQAQFAKLLQLILQDLADALAVKPVVVLHPQNVKVVNGSKIKQLLNHEELLDNEIESMFEYWNANSHGEGNNGRLLELFKAKGLELGLPPTECSAYLYGQIFSETADVVTEDLTRDAFHAIVKDIMKRIVDQLEANPIFAEVKS